MANDMSDQFDPLVQFEDKERAKELAQLDSIIEKKGLTRQSVDDWLNAVDYQGMNSGSYVPSAFSLKFMNFIKLVNGEEGEQHKTPVVHLKMLDEIAGKNRRIANLCARGLAKTTLMFEYLVLYIAVFGEIEGFGDISGMIYVSDSMDNGVKSARKNIEFRYWNSEFLQKFLPPGKDENGKPRIVFTDNYLEFTNQEGHKLGVKMFGAKTGLRGTKIFGKRPTVAVLDDLVSDDDSKSKAAMEAIKDTVYKGVDYALDPTKRKIIFNGTPFNKNDILYEAVESGGWHVNVYPVCERFPCTPEEYRGAWPDRFDYEFVLDQYETSLATGKISAFMQELMLRITSEEEKLVQDSEIRWYSRQALLQNRSRFNFYITTDFATSAKQHNDFSVISVWAYSGNEDWFWVDGICEKQTMDKNINALFKLASRYRPQSVGVEINGQQSAFIQWILNEQINRNIWFNLAQGKNGEAGLRMEGEKISRFNTAVPLFKAGKIYFPMEMRKTPIMGEFISEITMATKGGFKSKHDDACDTISMLPYLTPWKPSDQISAPQDDSGRWEDLDEIEEESSGLEGYIV